MTGERNTELQSIVRMLLYLRAEMQRHDLPVAAGHLDHCIDEIAREFLPSSADNVIDFQQEARSRGNST